MANFERLDAVQNLGEGFKKTSEAINVRVNDINKRLNAAKDGQFIAALNKLRTVAATIEDNAATISKSRNLQGAAVNFMGTMNSLTSVLHYSMVNKKKMDQRQTKDLLDKMQRANTEFSNLLKQNNQQAMIRDTTVAVAFFPFMLTGCVNVTSVNAVRVENTGSYNNGEYTSYTRTTVNGQTTETIQSNVEFSGREIPTRMTFMDRNGAALRQKGLGLSLMAHSPAKEQSILSEIKPQNTKKQAGLGGGNLEDTFTDNTGVLNDSLSFPQSPSKKWIMTVSNDDGFVIDYVVLAQPDLQKNYRNGTLTLNNVKLTRVRANGGF